MKRISIDPITRLEGHGKIEIFLADDGSVANCYFQIPELRGFEKFLQGMPVEEAPRIVARICGVCPAAHHLAAGKAVDAVYGVEPTSTAKKLRELYYSAHYVHSHIAHFYALAAPDFVLGPDSDPAKRNILGIVEKVGVGIGGEVLKHRRIAQDIQIKVGGKSTHPVWSVPGGVSKGLTEEERKWVEEAAASCVEFSKFSLKLFEDVVLKNKAYLDLILGDVFEIDSYWIGTVDAKNKVNFYDGDARVVDQKAKEVFRYKAPQYLENIVERVEPFSYLKFPYLKKVGWKGTGRSRSSSATTGAWPTATSRSPSCAGSRSSSRECRWRRRPASSPASAACARPPTTSPPARRSTRCTASSRRRPRRSCGSCTTRRTSSTATSRTSTPSPRPTS